MLQDPFNGWMIGGIAATVVGGIWYSYEQMNGKKSPANVVSPKADGKDKKEPTEGTRLTEDNEPGKASSPCVVS